MNIEELKAKNDELMEKYGWVVHYVAHPGEEWDGFMNAHTHGVKEKFNHLDLQIVFPLPYEIGMGIFHNIVNQIEEGKTFESCTEGGGNYSEILDGYDVCFLKVKEEETGRELLRVILPDVDGNLECLEMKSPYNEQYKIMVE